MSPIIFISGSSVFPVSFRTFSFTLLINSSISNDEAWPLLIKKLQCLSEIFTSPTENLSLFESLINFQALSPSGFLKVLPQVFTPFGTTLTAENYIGISNAAYADGAAATVQISGSVDDAQNSLTAGQTYFVQADGSLSLSEGVPSVSAGTAVSATKLIVKG